MILSFFERQFHSLSYTSTTLEVSAHWCDGLLLWWRSFGSLEKRVKFITRARTFCLFFFSRRTKCRVVCVCVSVCVWVVYLCIGIITIHSNEMLSFSNALSRIHCELTRSRSLSLIRSRSHSLASLQRWYYVHFVSCFKNQSFISWESFFSFFVWAM